MQASIDHPNFADAIAAASQHRHAISIQCVKQAVCFTGSALTVDHLFIYICEGSFTFRFGDKTYDLRKGHVAGIKKNILVQYHISPTDSAASYYVFTIKNDVVIEYTQLASLSQGGNVATEAIEVSEAGTQLFNFINSLHPWFLGKASLAGNLARIKLLELMFCLSASHPSIFEQLLVVREPARPDITRIVEENITNAVSLSQLARSAGRSISSFRRDFLAIYNMTPSRWIRQKRLEKAQELLVSTNMTITSICYTLGFESLSHFSRLFKSRFGYPPSELRVNSNVA